jgi:hypothetical protein
VSEEKNNSLTVADKFFIKENRGKGVDFLAEAIGKRKEFIELEVSLLEQEEFDAKNKPAEEVKQEMYVAPPESPLLKNFGRRKERGVVVMTNAASQVGDELGKIHGGIKFDPQSVNPCRK